MLGLTILVTISERISPTPVGLLGLSPAIFLLGRLVFIAVEVSGFLGTCGDTHIIRERAASSPGKWNTTAIPRLPSHLPGTGNDEEFELPSSLGLHRLQLLRRTSKAMQAPPSTTARTAAGVACSGRAYAALHAGRLL